MRALLLDVLLMVVVTAGLSPLSDNLMAAASDPEELGRGSAGEGLTLEWSDISYVTMGGAGGSLVSSSFSSLRGGRKRGGVRREKILHGASGFARPSRLLAILGPSGSGKSSLLHAIAGTIGAGNGGGGAAVLVGDVRVNGHHLSLDEMHDILAFVHQAESFYSFLTVKETMMMAAHLRLGRWSQEEKEEHVQGIMERLGLHLISDVMIGDKKNPGISGGERRRLAIGVALIGLRYPSLLFLDEPTSGLDSFQAMKVMEDLKALCDDGYTVVITIHQPRSSIFALIDDIVLLSEGHTVYAGDARKAVAHFERLGYKCPNNYNPADFLLDTISLDYTSTNGLVWERNRLSELAKVGGSLELSAKQRAHETVNGETAEMLAHIPPPRKACGFVGQFRLLLSRSWKQVARDFTAVQAKLIGGCFMGIVFGSIFWQLSSSVASGVNGRVSLIANIAINGAMVGIIRALQTFSAEKHVIMRERLEDDVNMGALLASKIVAELPLDFLFPLTFGPLVYVMANLDLSAGKFPKFMSLLLMVSHASSALGLMLGSIFPEDVALVLGPALNVIMVLCSGMNAEIPKQLKFLESISTIRWAMTGMLSNEFAGLRLDAEVKPLPFIGKFLQPPLGAGKGLVRGEDILRDIPISMKGMEGDRAIRKALRRLGWLSAIFHSITFVALSLSRPRFRKMQPLIASNGAKANEGLPAAGQRGAGDRVEISSPEGRSGSYKGLKIRNAYRMAPEQPLDWTENETKKQEWKFLLSSLTS